MNHSTESTWLMSGLTQKLNDRLELTTQMQKNPTQPSGHPPATAESQ